MTGHCVTCKKYRSLNVAGECYSCEVSHAVSPTARQESNARGTDLAMYIDQARAEGSKVGKFVATLKSGHEDDKRTIDRAATRFVNSLPLDDIKFERRLHGEFCESGAKALHDATHTECGKHSIADCDCDPKERL